MLRLERVGALVLALDARHQVSIGFSDARPVIVFGAPQLAFLEARLARQVAVVTTDLDAVRLRHFIKALDQLKAAFRFELLVLGD